MKFHWIILFFLSSLQSVGFCFFLFSDTHCQPWPTRIFSPRTCNLRRHCVCFPQYPRLTFHKSTFHHDFCRRWKSIWGHNEIIQIFRKWVMGMGLLFSFPQLSKKPTAFGHQWSRNSEVYLSSQTMTGLFGNLRSKMLLESIANPKAMAGGIQVWSDGKGHAKANQTPGSPLSQWGVFRALDGPSHRRALCVHRQLHSTTVVIMALFMLGAFSFIPPRWNALIRPFPKDRKKQRTLDRKTGEQNLEETESWRLEASWPLPCWV